MLTLKIKRYYMDASINESRSVHIYVSQSDLICLSQIKFSVCSYLSIYLTLIISITVSSYLSIYLSIYLSQSFNIYLFQFIFLPILPCLYQNKLDQINTKSTKKNVNIIFWKC